MKRSFLVACAALLLAAGSGPVHAEFKPTRPIDIVVHGGPGSGNDLLARALVTMIDQAKLSPVRMQVVNKPGGGSTNASSYLVSKRGDPHTIGIFTSVWIIDPLVQAEAKTKLTDLTPIARLIFEPSLVAVRSDSPYKTLADFINAAKEKPGQLKQSGGSVTSRDNILRQLLIEKTGARWSFISFPSGGERLAALLGGHVDIMIVDPSEAVEQVRSGKLRIIAQVGEKRLESFKDVPTLAEAGFDIPTVPQTRGVVGPPDMPADAVAYYENLVQKLTQTPAWHKYIEDNHFEDAFAKSDELSKFLVQFEGELRGFLKQAGAKLVR